MTEAFIKVKKKLLITSRLICTKRNYARKTKISILSIRLN